MRKCVVHTRVTSGKTLTPPAILEPFVHKALYDSPVVRKARQLMVDNPEVSMLMVRANDDRCYVITEVNDKSELAHYAIQLDPEVASTSEETPASE